MIGSAPKPEIPTLARILFAALFILALGCNPDSGTSGNEISSKAVSSRPECDDCPGAKVMPDPEPGPGEMVNPVFLSWRIYPEGTSTVLSTRGPDGSEMLERTKLLEKKERKITLSVETLRIPPVGSGKPGDSKQQTVILSYLIPQAGSPVGRNLDATPVAIDVLGKTFASFLSESRGTDSIGTFVTRRWDSDTIPGLLIRSERETKPKAGGDPQKTSTRLVELNFPKWDEK